MELNKFYPGNALDVLKTFPSDSVDCTITSPPYWGLRDYGTAIWIDGDKNCDHMQCKLSSDKSTLHQLPEKKKMETGIPYKDVCGKCGAIRKDEQMGLEKTPKEFVQKLADIFDEVKRVLKSTGTLWLNLGDSYVGGGFGASNYPATNHKWKQKTNGGTLSAGLGKNREYSKELKPKDLIGIPWMMAFELRRRGWYLRQDIIWSKRNPMPESVTDRCTKAHEYIFLLSKSPKYYYDAEAIKTPWKPNEHDIKRSIEGQPNYNGKHKNGYHNNKPDINRTNLVATGGVVGSALNGANKRSVWHISTNGYPDAHFATFPEELIEPCILAGTSEHGCCSECGSPYERIIDKKLVPTAKASFNSVADARDFSADKQDQGSNRQKDGHKPGWAYSSSTLGWKKTCKCRGGGHSSFLNSRSVFRSRHHCNAFPKEKQKFYWHRIKSQIYFYGGKKIEGRARIISKDIIKYDIR